MFSIAFFTVLGVFGIAIALVVLWRLFGVALEIFVFVSSLFPDRTPTRADAVRDTSTILPESGKLYSDDADFPSPPATAKTFPVKVEAIISYTDGEGFRTRRQITTERVSYWLPSGEGIITAHCHLRNAERSFYISRISEFTDLSTRQIVRDIGPYLEGCYERSPQGLVNHLWEKIGDEIVLLIYVGRAGSLLSRKKSDAIINYALSRADGAAVDRIALRDVIGQSTVEESDYRNALKTVSIRLRHDECKRLFAVMMQLAEPTEERVRPVRRRRARRGKEKFCSFP